MKTVKIHSTANVIEIKHTVFEKRASPSPPYS